MTVTTEAWRILEIESVKAQNYSPTGFQHAGNAAEWGKKRPSYKVILCDSMAITRRRCYNFIGGVQSGSQRQRGEGERETDVTRKGSASETCELGTVCLAGDGRKD